MAKDQNCLLGRTRKEEMNPKPKFKKQCFIEGKKVRCKNNHHQKSSLANWVSTAITSNDEYWFWAGIW